MWATYTHDLNKCHYCHTSRVRKTFMLIYQTLSTTMLRIQNHEVHSHVIIKDWYDYGNIEPTYPHSRLSIYIILDFIAAYTCRIMLLHLLDRSGGIQNSTKENFRIQNCFDRLSAHWSAQVKPASNKTLIHK